ncbi:MAG: NADH-quinone oxidoreductase subunit H [Bacteroidales bacterium]|nr:NADH-quinone oxidoreductase subunit H [Bacteroidales bacterium]
MNIYVKIAYTFLGLMIVLNWGMLMRVTFRKIGARMAGRHGVPFRQPWIDLIKNIAVRTTLTHGVMFYLGPVFRFSGAVGLFLFMPILFGKEAWMNFSFEGDLVLILYFQLFGMLGMALGAGEGGQPHSAIGISRGLAQHAAVELPMTMGIIALAIQYQTLSISEIVAAQQGGFLHWSFFTNPVASAAIMLSALGAFGYSPFNLVKAPNEIPIGPPTEYHGTYLGVLMTSGNILGVMETILFMNLVFGGATNWFELIIKSFLIYFYAVFVGMVFPRFRIEQSVAWFFKIPLLLGFIAILMYSF